MDPIGLGLENYDHFGQWRETYANGNNVVSNGQLFSKSFANAKGLNEVLRASDQVSDCIKKKLISYATGTSPFGDKECSIQQISITGSGKEVTMKEVIINTVTSDAFTQVRGK
jgi:hypothetical protein